MFKRLTLAGAVLAGVCLAAEQGPFTLEQVLSSAFPSALTAAPAGGKVAWVVNARGARNIWVAEPPDYKGRQITGYNADDGQEITELQWTPDARWIVYVRGGDANRQGEYPNPRSDPKGIEQALWVIAAAGGEPRQIGEGHSPAIEPNAAHVAFLRKNQIWWAPLDASSKPAQLIHARGECGALRWSPDGSKLAFVSNRRDHSFIGVYELASRSLRYLDPSLRAEGNAELRTC